MRSARTAQAEPKRCKTRRLQRQRSGARSGSEAIRRGLSEAECLEWNGLGGIPQSSRPIDFCVALALGLGGGDGGHGGDGGDGGGGGGALPGGLGGALLESLEDKEGGEGEGEGEGGGPGMDALALGLGLGLGLGLAA